MQKQIAADVAGDLRSSSTAEHTVAREEFHRQSLPSRTAAAAQTCGNAGEGFSEEVSAEQEQESVPVVAGEE